MKEEEERAVRLAKATLEKRAWPQVAAVFVYLKDDTPPTPEEQVRVCSETLKSAGLPFTAAFVDLIGFEEKRRNIAMLGYSLSLRPRFLANVKNPTPEQMMQAMAQPDLLIGSRKDGGQTAMEWIKDYTDNIRSMPIELLQLTDKVMEEAVGVLSTQMGVTTTLKELIRGEVTMSQPQKPN